MAPGGWLVTVGDGIMEACSVAYVFKTLTLRDWLNYSERFGTPGILGKTDAAIGSNGWRAMEEALQKFSVDWASVTNPTNDIHLVEAKNGNNQPFKLLVDLMDEEMTRLWRGGDLGTSSKQNSVGASLQSAESEILEVDDAAMLSETLTLKVSRFALNWKFGPHAPQLAYIKVKAAEKQNTQLDLLIDQFLLAAGFPISKASAGERYGRALPKAGGDLLTPTSAPLASANKLAPEIIP
jgi:phage gp29-like protein